MSIVEAFVLPHPPLIIPAVGRGDERKISRTIQAYETVANRIFELDPDTIIIVSPHAPSSNNRFSISYGINVHGDMSDFGAPEECVNVTCDQRLSDLIRINSERTGIRTSANMLERTKLDHASTIPLWFVNNAYRRKGTKKLRFKVVIIGLSLLSPEEHKRFGAVIAEVMRVVKTRAVFIASGDLSHRLLQSGPYGYAEEGPIFDKAICDIFRNGDFASLFRFNSTFCEHAAECGLRSFQIMAGALEGSWTSDLLSYEGIFGVGYAVARFWPNLKDKAIPQFDSMAPPDQDESTFKKMPSSTVALNQRVIVKDIASAANDFPLTEQSKTQTSVENDSETYAFQDNQDSEGPIESCIAIETSIFQEGEHDIEEASNKTENHCRENEELQESNHDDYSNSLTEKNDKFKQQQMKSDIDPYIALARRSIEYFVLYRATLPVPRDLPDEMLKKRRGVFVSIHKQGSLRGCIGTIISTKKSIAEEVISNAIMAASEDPRFMPVQAPELEEIELSVDVLGKPETVKSLRDLNPRKYGVIVSKGDRKGLLLPSLDGIDTIEQQVEIAKQKAGISPDEQDIILERFEVVRHEYVTNLKERP